MLWWAYPLVGPGPERMLVLAADAERLSGDGGDRETVVSAGTGSASPPVSPCTPTSLAADELAPRPARDPAEHERRRERPDRLPGARTLGYPVLEFSQHDRVPVTADWGVSRRTERQERRAAAARAAATGVPSPRAPLDDTAEDIEYAAVRERLEFSTR